MTTIGAQIRELRQAKNYTQRQLAEHIDGVTQTAVSAAERNRTNFKFGQGMVSQATAERILEELQQLPALPGPEPAKRQPRKPKWRYPPRELSAKQFPMARHCGGDHCGILIFNDVADVPDSWVTWLHIDCGGYCPPCAKRNGLAHLVRQKAKELRTGVKRQKEQEQMKVEKVLEEVLAVETENITPPPPMNSKWSPLLQTLAGQPAGVWIRVKFTSKKTATNARAAIHKFYRDGNEQIEMRGMSANGDDGTYWLYCRKLARKKDGK